VCTYVSLHIHIHICTCTCTHTHTQGLRAILVIFLVSECGFSEGLAIATFGYSSAIAYFMPLLGGYYADVHAGKFITILRFSAVYCMGCVILAVSATGGEDLIWPFLAGLLIVGVGTGGIKPCVSAFGADQLSGIENDRSGALTSRYYETFYFCINVGSLVSFICVPLLKAHVSYFWAFGVSAIAMLLATSVFYSGKAQYTMVEPQGSVLSRVCRVFWRARMGNNNSSSGASDDLFSTQQQQEEYGEGQFPPWEEEGEEPEVRRHWLYRALWNQPTTAINASEEAEEAEGEHNGGDRSTTLSGEDVDNARALLNISGVFMSLPFFWTLLDQQGSTWTLQAEKMDTHGFEPEQMGVVNPVLILFLIPLMGKVVYPFVERKTNSPLTPLQKMGAGMLFASAAFMVSASVQSIIDGAEEEQSVSVFLQLPQIFLITISEVLISITGLEFFYVEAPTQLKSTISSLFLLTTALGDLFAGVLYSSLSGVGAVFMLWIFSILMLMNFGVFLWVSSRFTSINARRAGAAHYARIVADDSSNSMQLSLASADAHQEEHMN
jgi:POT family proton-dependent oligopeptide transporter